MKNVVVRVVVIGLLAAGAAPSVATDPVAEKLFVKEATPPCGLCHALGAAGTAGSIGPSLDEMKPDAERVARVIRSGLGAMPAYPQLTDAQVKAIAQYVARATGASK
jgi:sulfite dehydrogenase